MGLKVDNYHLHGSNRIESEIRASAYKSKKKTCSIYAPIILLLKSVYCSGDQGVKCLTGLIF